MRFPIRIDPIWRPLLLAIGVTRQRAYVQVGDKDLTFRFGFWFHRTFPRGEIAGAAAGRWPILLGGRLVQLYRGEIGLIGYEINFNRYFYRYTPPRPLEEIEADIRGIEADIMRMLAEVTGSEPR